MPDHRRSKAAADRVSWVKSRPGVIHGRGVGPADCSFPDEWHRPERHRGRCRQRSDAKGRAIQTIADDCGALVHVADSNSDLYARSRLSAWRIGLTDDDDVGAGFVNRDV
jgi:hypothetical protein